MKDVMEMRVDDVLEKFSHLREEIKENEGKAYEVAKELYELQRKVYEYVESNGNGFFRGGLLNHR